MPPTQGSDCREGPGLIVMLMSQGKKWLGITVPGEQSWPQRTQSPPTPSPPHLTAYDSWVFAYFFRSSLRCLFAVALPSSHNPSLLLQQAPTPGSSHRPFPLEYFFSLQGLQRVPLYFLQTFLEMPPGQVGFL